MTQEGLRKIQEDSHSPLFKEKNMKTIFVAAAIALMLPVFAYAAERESSDLAFAPPGHGPGGQHHPPGPGCLGQA